MLSEEITHQADEGELDPGYRVVDVNRLDNWAARVAKLERVATAAQELLLAQGSVEIGYGPILQEAEARMIDALKELEEADEV
jgi:hypothetical protein